MDVVKTERDRLIERATGAATLEEVGELRRAMNAWLEAHPDDAGIRGVEARLAEMEALLLDGTPIPVAYNTTGPQFPKEGV